MSAPSPIGNASGPSAGDQGQTGEPVVGWGLSHTWELATDVVGSACSAVSRVFSSRVDYFEDAITLVGGHAVYDHLPLLTQPDFRFTEQKLFGEKGSSATSAQPPATELTFPMMKGVLRGHRIVVAGRANNGRHWFLYQVGSQCPNLWDYFITSAKTPSVVNGTKKIDPNDDANSVMAAPKRIDLSAETSRADQQRLEKLAIESWKQWSEGVPTPADKNPG